LIHLRRRFYKYASPTDFAAFAPFARQKIQPPISVPKGEHSRPRLSGSTPSSNSLRRATIRPMFPAAALETAREGACALPQTSSQN
jgi:hypothetical protein